MTINVPRPAPYPAGMEAFEGAQLDEDDAAGAALLVPLLRLDAAMHAYERTKRMSAPVRIVRGVTNHFSLRVSEWFSTFLLLQFGLILYGPSEVFPHAPNLAVMATWASEETWGAVCLVIGGVHLAALTVNGTFPRFPFSPHIRALASFLACFLWFQITMAIFMSGVGGTGLGTYRLVLLLEIWNVFHACLDAGKAEARRSSDGR